MEGTRQREAQGVDQGETPQRAWVGLCSCFFFGGFIGFLFLVVCHGSFLLVYFFKLVVLVLRWFYCVFLIVVFGLTVKNGSS